MEKFELKKEKKEQCVTRSIQFPKDLFTKINKIRGDISLNKFIIQAVEYAISNMKE